MAGGRGTWTASPHDVVSQCSISALTAISTCRQDARLTALWEQHGGRPGHLDRIASALDAGVTKSAVAARLKALGLKRGVLTEGQVRSSLFSGDWCDAVGTYC